MRRRKTNVRHADDLAMGSPFGLEQIVTARIVSALDRKIEL
jgi:S1-C subfamily serine protease